MAKKERILLTCPPMIGVVERLDSEIDALGFKIEIPDFVQVVEENRLVELVPQYDGWIIGDDPATRRVFESGVAGSLRAAVKWGVGVDNVDFDACKTLGLPISNTPNMFGAEVADVAMGYLLGLARHLFAINARVHHGEWYKPPGQSLSGKRVGIVGLGDIGASVARRCDAFGLQVIGYDPYVTNAPYQVVQWPDQLQTVDFLVLTCKLTPETMSMVNGAVLDRMKSSAYIINVSRGGLIVEDDLVSALQAGKISGAALEVFAQEPLPPASPLVKLDNVIFGSHNGSNTTEAALRASRKALAILSGFLKEAQR